MDDDLIRIRSILGMPAPADVPVVDDPTAYSTASVGDLRKLASRLRQIAGGVRSGEYETPGGLCQSIGEVADELEALQ